jgi:hypothetical protein
MSSEVLGVKQLQTKLNTLRASTQNKLERSAVSAALRVTAKAIKSEVPSTWKEGRKAIGYSFARGKGKWTGATFAKAGVGAGIRKKARDKRDQNKSDRAGRKGVGIGVSNFHWFILGTAERETGSKRVGAHRRGVINKRVATGGKVQKTGRMKPNPIVQRGAEKGRAASLKAMAENFKSGIEREAAKK